jgi:outer membrane protein assembly factor BamB
VEWLSLEDESTGLAMYRTGQTERWRLQPEGWVHSSPALLAVQQAITASPVVAGDVLYVASYDQTLTALDAHDRTLRWQFAARGAIHATPGVSDGRVYVATLDGVVHALQ